MALESFDQIGARVAKPLGGKTDPAKVRVPPYCPHDPVIRKDWAACLDSVRLTDKLVRNIVKRLKEEGNHEGTAVLFTIDHGISHARGKAFLYVEGLHVPLVLAGPTIEPGQVSDDLVEHINIAAFSLGLAGIDILRYMHAREVRQ